MALRSRAVSGTCRDSFRCTRCALISITVLRKRKRRLARSESRFGSIAARFSIQRRRWRAAPVRIRSTRRAPANVNDARARDANAKVDLMDVDRGQKISSHKKAHKAQKALTDCLCAFCAFLWRE